MIKHKSVETNYVDDVFKPIASYTYNTSGQIMSFEYLKDLYKKDEDFKEIKIKYLHNSLLTTFISTRGSYFEEIDYAFN